MTAAFFIALAFPPPSLSFAQCDIDFHGSTAQDSSYGFVVLDHQGFNDDMYLNVNVDGRWEVENALVVVSPPFGQQQRQGFHFSLGVPDGTDVTTVMTGYSVTPGTVAVPPPLASAAPVGSKIESVHGTAGSVIFHTPAKRWVGKTKKLPVGSKGEITGVPNQPCGPNQCVPTAISNLLKWLKSKFPGWKLPDDKTSIAAVAAALGWGPDGVPFNQWVEAKRTFLKPFGIKTTKHNQSEGDVDKMIMGLNSGTCVIEMEVGKEDQDGGHCVAVTSMTKLEGGKCQVTVVHDPEQKNGATDPLTETITFEMSTGKITSGPPWATDKKIHGFAMECMPMVKK